MSKELTALKALQDMLEYLLCYDEFNEERHKNNAKIIETALKNYQELIEKPCVLVGRTHGYAQALIDTICKNYKEVKITNLEDEKKLKALEIIKKKISDMNWFRCCDTLDQYNKSVTSYRQLTQEEFDLVKEALL